MAINFNHATDTISTSTGNFNVAANYPGATIRPSLLLNFANTKRLDKRISFARASIATRYNQDGLIEIVAANQPRFDHDPSTKQSLGLLMEEQKTNLLKYSNNMLFDTSVWVQTSLSTRGAACIAPDGSLSGVLLNATSNSGVIAQDLVITAGDTTIRTFSVYLKQGSAATTDFYLAYYSSGTSNYMQAKLTWGTMVVTAVVQTAGNSTFTQPQNVGNGWYRVSITGSNSGGANTRIQVVVYPAAASTGSCYVWGAQVETGEFMTSYIPSNDTFTSRASFGSYYDSTGLIKYASTNVARYTYNPANLKLAPTLLIEPASTNLFYYSEQFDNTSYWTVNTATVSANVTTAPNNRTTAYKLNETATTDQHFVAQSLGTVSSGAVYTMSVYAKAADRTQLSLTSNGEAYVAFDLVTGTVIQQGSNNATIIPVGNGWFRCTATFTKTNTAGVFYYIVWNGTNSYLGTLNYGVYIWGAQVESGSSATSYINTASSTVTRSSDICTSSQNTRIGEFAAMTGTNFLNWYRQDEGTLHATSRLMSTTTAVSVPTMAWVDNATGGSPTLISLRYVSGSGSAVIDSYGFNNSVSQWDLNGPAVTSQTVISCALAYATNDIALSVSGSTTETDTSAAVGQGMSRMLIGPYQNLHILKLAYYPKRLTNAELQAMST
jgi:hypothetical protein